MAIAAGASRKRIPARRAGLLVATLATLLIAWQIGAGGASSPYAAIPSPASVLAALNRPGPNAPQLLQELPTDVLLTVSHALLGLLLGVLTGVPVGVAMARSHAVNSMFDPYITALNALPRIALLPFLVIAFGFGPIPGIILIWSAAFVAVVLNTVAGVRSVQRIHLDHVRVLGATPFQADLFVLLPTLVPWLVSATRLGIGYAFTTAILAESAGVNSGLGYLLVWYAGQAFAPGAFLVVSVVPALALLLDGVLVGVQRLVAPATR